MSGPSKRAMVIRRRLQGVAREIARLEAQKGITDLLDAAAMLPDVVFEIAGEGPQRDQLVAKAATLGVADRVRWLGHRDDVPALLAAADLFVLPSLNEGLPLAAMEAMLAGVPIVATDAGGTGEIVRDGITGVLVPPGDPEALSASIRALLSDRPRAARLAIAARELIEDFFGANVSGRGQWRVGLRTVTDDLSLPMLHCTASGDRITPAQTAPASAGDVIQLNSGHVGMIVGRARVQLHQALLRFLAS